jgi:hypothetical protein
MRKRKKELALEEMSLEEARGAALEAVATGSGGSSSPKAGGGNDGDGAEDVMDKPKTKEELEEAMRGAARAHGQAAERLKAAKEQEETAAKAATADGVSVQQYTQLCKQWEEEEIKRGDSWGPEVRSRQRLCNEWLQKRCRLALFDTMSSVSFESPETIYLKLMGGGEEDSELRRGSGEPSNPYEAEMWQEQVKVVEELKHKCYLEAQDKELEVTYQEHLGRIIEQLVSCDNGKRELSIAGVREQLKREKGITGSLESGMKAKQKSYEQLVSRLEQSVMKLKLAMQKAQTHDPSKDTTARIAEGLLNVKGALAGVRLW